MTPPISLPPEPTASVLRRNIDPDDGWRFVRRTDGYYDYSHLGQDLNAVMSWPEVLGHSGTEGVIPATPLYVEIEDLAPQLKQAFVRIEQMEHDRSRSLRHRAAADQLVKEIYRAIKGYHVAYDRSNEAES